MCFRNVDKFTRCVLSSPLTTDLDLISLPDCTLETELHINTLPEGSDDHCENKPTHVFLDNVVEDATLLE